MEPDVPKEQPHLVTRPSRKRGITTYKTNPFIELSEVRTRRKRVRVSGGKAIIDVETGQVEDLAEIVSVKEVDDEQFVKIFTQNLKAFFNLTPVAMKLMQVILAKVQEVPNRDQILLSIAVAEDYFASTQQESISKTSFHRAVRELIEKQFIAESVFNNLYFINPHLFFNGDRVRFINEYRRKKSDVKHAKVVEALQNNALASPQFPDDCA
jgi:hypothetical protein